MPRKDRGIVLAPTSIRATAHVDLRKVVGVSSDAVPDRRERRHVNLTALGHTLSKHDSRRREAIHRATGTWAR